MGIAVRLGGFEVRDCGQWCYWSGFPKSRNLSIDMDKEAGAMGHRGQRVKHHIGQESEAAPVGMHAHVPITDNARKWSGFGTAVKPAVEPWLLLRKPISESSIARCVLRWGVGGLNIDACRFAPGDSMWPGPQENDDTSRPTGTSAIWGEDMAAGIGGGGNRFPANLVHVAKASRKERELGCEGLPTKTGAEAVKRTEGSAGKANPRAGAGRTAEEVRNHHPTVKPVKLMQWLVRLVTPPGGTCLDPFMGSGTTGVAAVSQGFGFIGMELDAGHLRICRARVAHAAVGRDVECELEPEPPAPGQISMWGTP